MRKASELDLSSVVIIVKFLDWHTVKLLGEVFGHKRRQFLASFQHSVGFGRVFLVLAFRQKSLRGGSGSLRSVGIWATARQDAAEEGRLLGLLVAIMTGIGSESLLKRRASECAKLGLHGNTGSGSGSAKHSGRTDSELHNTTLQEQQQQQQLKTKKIETGGARSEKRIGWLAEDRFHCSRTGATTLK